MASLGHIAVGMAAARLYDSAQPLPSVSSIAFLSAVSLLPDADVIGMAFGIAYEDTWGHRGATHSFVFAAAIGVAVGLAAGARKLAWRRAALAAAIVAASHPVLDTFTDGGLGCALFWPFDNARYFAPWRPIPVAPIGLNYFSFYGGVVAITEIVLFGPLFLYALWPFRNVR